MKSKFDKYCFIKQKDTKNIRRILRDFIIMKFYDYDDSYQYNKHLTNITNVEVYKHLLKKEKIVRITAISPGIVIGKGGENIDKMKDYLNEKDTNNITIELVELKLWNVA